MGYVALCYGVLRSALSNAAKKIAGEAERRNVERS